MENNSALLPSMLCAPTRLEAVSSGCIAIMMCQAADEETRGAAAPRDTQPRREDIEVGAQRRSGLADLVWRRWRTMMTIPGGLVCQIAEILLGASDTETRQVALF